MSITLDKEHNEDNDKKKLLIDVYNNDHDHQEFYHAVTQSTFPCAFIRDVCQLQQTYLRNNRSSNEKSLKGFPNYNEGKYIQYTYTKYTCNINIIYTHTTHVCIYINDHCTYCTWLLFSTQASRAKVASV